jgi:dTMP kinase
VKTGRQRARGRLITLEGGEGAGKSTQAHFVADWLRARGREVVVTREPGGAPLAEQIRELVLRAAAAGLPPKAETLLMFAARAVHLEHTILPALQRGHDVVCDRFVDSSYAYQGAGKGVDRRFIAALERGVAGSLRPDLVLLFDLPPELGLRRARKRGQQNRFEAESLAFMHRVRRAFRRRARAAPRRYVLLDAARSLEEVQAELRQALERRL